MKFLLFPSWFSDQVTWILCSFTHPVFSFIWTDERNFFLLRNAFFFLLLSLQNNQADLENATEVLSGYLERDISQDSLQDIKQKVQDKYRFVPEQLSQSCPSYCIVIHCGMLWCGASPSWPFLQSCPWEAVWCQPPAVLWDPLPAPEPQQSSALCQPLTSGDQKQWLSLHCTEGALRSGQGWDRPAQAGLGRTRSDFVVPNPQFWPRSSCCNKAVSSFHCLLSLLAQHVPWAKSECRKAVLRKRERTQEESRRARAQVIQVPVLFVVLGELLLRSGKIQRCKMRMSHRIMTSFFFFFWGVLPKSPNFLHPTWGKTVPK